MEQNQPQTSQANEIDLPELICALWSQKILILVCVVVVTCMTAAYAFMATPVYETTVQMLPPRVSDLVGYNAASELTEDAAKSSSVQSSVQDTDEGIKTITPNEAYAIFLKHLASDTVRQEFFERYYLPGHSIPTDRSGIQWLHEKLDDELTIIPPKKPTDLVSEITLEGHDPAVIAAWANDYVNIALARARQELLDNLAGYIQVRGNSIAKQITVLSTIARGMRDNQIVRTKDALSIAESIGLEVPPAGAPLIAISGQHASATNTFSNGDLMYLRGAKALRSELAQLEQRQNDEAYTPELPGLRKAQALLQSVELTPKNLTAAIIDKAATEPEDPIKPQKALILALGVILGIMLGLFAALMRHIFRQP
ncbi:Wzz/FepE/Etk N-terminal domain-containing protein [Pollutimonas sp. H1-120]|uniref:LPS O-antigen chain length determinant protein WzzB n=1 Tax=Pollutimonas sp. H1-120 TaxID=3148824 RepID=UPI003B52D271